MFYDPWTREVKIGITSDVPEPRRLELESAIVRFEGHGDKLVCDLSKSRHTPYVNARKPMFLVFDMGTTCLENVGQKKATLYIKFAEERGRRHRTGYAAIACEPGQPVQVDPRHVAHIWRMRRAGLVGAVRYVYAVATAR